ncbi:MAG: acyl-phosphate glycerol 3-phosphate acyltransferase [Planctomycetota bacterium]|nr:MAG: acyl-phosphate glycerol 3-phosphate acyltransferase [Planctomycetota bacterium]
MRFAFALLLAFLLGAIPFGFLVVRVFLGIDVRTRGSGNIGATNAARCFAKRWKLVAFLGIYALDFFKGWLPVLLLGPWLLGDPVLGSVLIGLSAVLGHVFTPYLGFKGGKGVATSCGVLFGLDWLALLLALAVFALVLGLTRVVALGSIALGIGLAVAVIALHPEQAFGERLAVTMLALFLAVFLVWTHRSNLKALGKG